MINVDGREYYTVKDLTVYLNLKPAMVIVLLRQSGAQKYKNKYIADQELADRLKNRENRTPKIYDFDSRLSYTEMINHLSRPKKLK